MKFSLIAFLASIISFVSCSTAKAPKAQLLSYSYHEYGSAAEPNCDFTVEYVDESVCKVIYFNHLKMDRESLEERDTTFCNASLLKDIETQINEKKMYNYKKDYHPMLDVLDGCSWGMTIRYKDGTSVNSGGYQAWPKGHGISIIEDMVKKQVEGIN